MIDNTVAVDRMHGSLFVLLKRFVESRHHYSAWVQLREEAGIAHEAYQMDGMYPTSELFALVQRASEKSGVTVYEYMEQYGEYIVPDLMLVYSRYVQPHWRTYDMLLNTEEAMHGAVRRQDGRTAPPKLLVTKKGDRQLIVDYHSKRRMSGVAVGIIRGIAAYFQEAERVRVTRTTPADESRVQMTVDFLS